MTPPMASRLGAADWAAAGTVVLLWGFNFVAVKTAVSEIPPFLLTGLRFLGVALLLAPFFRPRRDQLPGILLLAVVMGVCHFGVLFYGIGGLDAATSAIAAQLGVPFASLMAWAAFREKLGWWRAGGMTVSFAGVALLAGEPHLPRLLPLAAVVGASAAWGVSNVVVKRIGPINPLALNGWMGLFSAPLLLGLSLALEDGQRASLGAASGPAWGSVAYIVVGSTVIAYSLWYRLLARHPMNRVVPFTLMGPVIGVAAGVLMLGEPLTWHKLVGGVLTVLGVAAIQLVPPSPVTPPEEPEPGA